MNYTARSIPAQWYCKGNDIGRWPRIRLQNVEQLTQKTVTHFGMGMSYRREHREDERMKNKPSDAALKTYGTLLCLLIAAFNVGLSAAWLIWSLLAVHSGLQDAKTLFPPLAMTVTLFAVFLSSLTIAKRAKLSTAG